MADDLKDPQAVQVSATISFHEAIKAVVLYSAKYPQDRIDKSMIDDLSNAAYVLMKRYETRDIVRRGI